MKTIRYILAVCFALVVAHSNAQDATNMTDRGAASQNLAVNPTRLLGLCEGQRGAYWCDGFLAAALASMGIKPNDECLPHVEVYRFIHEDVWVLTREWLVAQPARNEVTLYEAIENALNEHECDL